MTKLLYFLYCFFIVGSTLYAQEVRSENGWKLPVNGELRVLVFYVEIEYDLKPETDPYKKGNKTWSKGELPTWKDDLFSPDKERKEQGKITRYFNQMSFENYNLYGDYYPDLIQVKESEIKSINSRSSSRTGITNKLIELTDFKTKNLLDSSLFDFWDMNVSSGVAKKKLSNGKFDHVMLIIRNARAYGNGAGHVVASSIGNLFNMASDSYSVFGAGSALPFNILRHEYSHMLFGGNNFHCGGGQHYSGGYNHFIPFQGGWSMLGGYGSSFQTANAWDRDRLGWKLKDKVFSISALNLDRKEVESKIKASDTLNEIEFIIRDFVTSGDAIQIQLPGIPENEYQQYLWLENHQTYSNNQSEFDQFQFEHAECVPNATPGVYMYLQVAHDNKVGSNIFKGHADYLRNIPADGFHDVKYGDTLVQNNWCINNGMYYPFIKKKKHENPLTGGGDQEETAVDDSGQGHIGKREGRKKVIEKKNGEYRNELAIRGHSRHAFTVNGVNEIGIGTNPSTSSMVTLVSYDRAKGDEQDNRSVVLNGLKVSLLEQLSDGSIKVKIAFNKTVVEENRRWCGTIVLPPIKGENDYSLELKKKKKIELCQGYTATKVDAPILIKKENVFCDSTRLTIQSEASVLLQVKSKLILKDNSSLKFSSNSKLKFERGSRIVVNEGATLIMPVTFNQRKIMKRINAKKGAKLIFIEY